MTKVRVYRGRNNRGCACLVIVLLALICIGPFAAAGGLLFAATRGAFGEPEVLTARYDEPVGEAETAAITLVLGVSELTLGALNTEAQNVFEADVTYVGGIDYAVRGDEDKRITLRQTQGDLDVLGALSFFNININPTETPLGWTVNLSPDLPLALNVEGGAGSFELNLADLNITDLHLETGVGAANVTLPQPTESLTVRINGGIGTVNLTLPAEVPLRIEADQGIGGIRVPAGLERLSGTDNIPNSGGVWESPGFDEADIRVTILYDGGIGGLTVQQ